MVREQLSTAIGVGVWRGGFAQFDNTGRLLHPTLVSRGAAHYSPFDDDPTTRPHSGSTSRRFVPASYPCTRTPVRGEAAYARSDLFERRSRLMDAPSPLGTLMPSARGGPPQPPAAGHQRVGGVHSILGGLLMSSSIKVTDVTAVRASSPGIALQTSSGLEGPGSKVVPQTQTDARKADVAPW